MTSMRHATVGKREEEKNCEDQCEEACPMTWTQRIIGYASCFCLGLLISFGSWMRFGDCMGGDCTSFGFLFSFGNCIMIAGSFFLAGPCTQFFEMFRRVRCIATITFLSAIVLTVIVACIPFDAQGGIIILLCITQYVSSIWYCLTYVKMPGWNYTAADFITEKCCGCSANAHNLGLPGNAV